MSMFFRRNAPPDHAKGNYLRAPDTMFQRPGKNTQKP